MMRAINSTTALLAFALLAFGTNSFAQQRLGFGQVIDNLDLKKNTKLHVQEYWRAVDGKEVRWAGQVLDVKGGGSRAKIWLADKSRPTYKGYNIVLTMDEVGQAAKLKKGQHVRFKGFLSDYDANRRGGAVITLRDAELL